MALLDTPAPSSTPGPIWNTVLRYGGICGLAMVVFSLLSYLMGINPMAISTMLINFVVTLGITIGIACVAIKFQRELDGGYISFGRAFLIGLGTLAIGVFLSGFWNYVLVNFIDPEYLETLKEQFQDTWGESMPEDQLEEAIARFDDGKSLVTNLKNSLIGAVLFGLIGGLISAAIMRRNPPIN